MAGSDLGMFGDDDFDAIDAKFVPSSNAADLLAGTVGGGFEPSILSIPGDVFSPGRLTQGASVGAVTAAAVTVAAAQPVATIATIGTYIATSSPSSAQGAHWTTGSTVSVNLSGLALAGELLYARTALAAWSAVANIKFVETAGAGQITMTDDANFTSYNAYTQVSYGSTTLTSASIHITQKWYNNNGGALGTTGILNSYGYQTYLHELGHALGLGHAGPYNGTATYGTSNIYANDSWQYSVMSYFDQTNYGGASFAYVTSAMQADIYGMQLLYGAPGTQTNTKFGYNATAGAVYNLAQSNSFTIYSATGTADLDASLYSGAQTVNFNAGSFSSIKGLTNNVGLALNTSLTSYEGGSGNDTIILDSSNLNDFVNGGAGTDTVDITYSYGSGYLLRAGGTASSFVMVGAAGADTLQNIEFVHFADGTTVSTASLVSTTPRLGAPSDFNGDGTSDILVEDNNGSVADWTMKNGVLQGWSSLGFEAGWKVAGTGDFNGDGTSDILWSNSSGQVVDWKLSNGALISSSLVGTAAGWTTLGTGDFNGDLTSDILFKNASGQVVEWRISNGNISQSALIGTVSSEWKYVGVGDFNGDGTQDILWRSSISGAIVDWTMSNGSLASSALLGSSATRYQIAGTGDFNGDGTTDILFRDTNNGDVIDWTVSAGRLAKSTFLANASLNWAIQAIGDYNGNGTSGIIFSNADTGQTVDWSLSNGALNNSTLIGTPPPGAWTIRA